MTAIQPNQSRIEARVVSLQPSPDGWGASAELHFERVSPIAGAVDFAAQYEGTTQRVFVPPPLVAALVVGKHWTGDVTVGGGPDATLSLVPPPVKISK